MTHYRTRITANYQNSRLNDEELSNSNDILLNHNNPVCICLIINSSENITTQSKKALLNANILHYAFNAILNQIAEPRNSKNLLVANTSTPILNRAIFVCSTRTPQEFNQSKIGSVTLLSMVACSGKGFALCCVPQVAVFEPVTRCRPSLETLAVTSKNILVELSAMIYLFLCANRTRQTYSEDVVMVKADNETQAIHKLTATHRHYLTVAKYRDNQHHQAESKLKRLVRHLADKYQSIHVEGVSYA